LLTDEYMRLHSRHGLKQTTPSMFRYVSSSRDIQWISALLACLTEIVLFIESSNPSTQKRFAESNYYTHQSLCHAQTCQKAIHLCDTNQPRICQ